jgi:MFS family permease
VASRRLPRLWTGETISQFGSQISQLAIPLTAILVLDATAFEVAALTTVEFLPFIIFTLPAGVWVDRMRRRPILIAGDVVRALLLGSIPIAYVLDALTLGQLFVVGFLFGICTVFFDVAYQSYLPSLVERNQIIEGNSKLEITRSAAQIGGPGLGGVLIECSPPPTPFCSMP